MLPWEHPFSPAELGVVLNWRNERGEPKFDGTNLPKGLHRRVVATAHISHGRWVADCPTPGCHSADYVSPDDPRMFCVRCENLAAEGKWVKVDFPRSSVIDRIEQELLKRPLAENRNWFPYESLKDLQRENAEHEVTS